MKNILYLFCLLPFIVKGQTSTQNYIRTYIYKDSTNTTDASKANASVTYFDGLGRPIQQIAGKMSGTGKDIITHIEYDNFGRQSKDYLPYEAATTDLSFVGSASTDVINFYNNAAFENTQNPYSEKFFEASPLSRVLKQGAPGTAWKGNMGNDNDHTVKYAYLANTDADEVGRYRVTSVWDPVSEVYNTSIILDGNYPAGQLYKTYTQDENKTSAISTAPGINFNVVQEYKNKEGQIILKKTNVGSTDNFGMPTVNGTSTYYVYDQFGNLSFVLPLGMSGTLSTDVLNLYCYQYKYDARNRLVEKKLPGRDWEYIVYDKMDRPVASGPVYSPYGSTGNSAKGWMITKYDVFGRVAYTGWYATVTAFSSAARKTMQANTFSTVAKSVTAVSIDNIQLNYTNVGFPTSDMKLLTVNYYDNYAFTGAAAIPADVEGQALAANVKGLPTGTWNRILTTATQTYAEITTTFYDAKGRPIRVRAANTAYGGYTQTDTKLDFEGTPLYNVTRHKRTSSSSETELKTQNDFTYTAQDRLLSQTHTIGNGTAQLMSYNSYDAIGQLTSKNVGRTQASPLQKVDFTYNIRGWLTGINNISTLRPLRTDIQDLFAFKINYTTVEGLANTSALYNGNIAETSWRTASDNIIRRYSYKYDELNRLRDAYYQIPNATDSPLRQSYDEHIKYDIRGNITSLTRNGGVDAPSPVVQIDNLKYYYNGNQLIRVEDTSNSPQGYRDLTTGTANDFAYDTFGNLTSDYNKGFDLIIYNHLNLPLTVQVDDGGYNIGLITYLYTATGTKVRKTYANYDSGDSKITDYINGYQYTGSVLDFFPTSEGYVKNTVVNGVNNYSYVYQYKDHLGNVRVSYTLDAGEVKIMDENHYYPFGMEHEGYRSTQNILGVEPGYIVRLIPVINPGDVTYKYKYNGKELQDELGLNMYDYGARNYDPALGRWMNIDPLAEKHYHNNPYMYANNNPVIFVDPDGMDFTLTGTAAQDWVRGEQSRLKSEDSKGGGDSKGDGGRPNIFQRAWNYVFGNKKESSVKAEEGTWSFVDSGNILLELSGESRIFNKVLEIQEETANSSPMMRWQSMAGGVLMEEKFMNGGLMTSMGIGSHGTTPMLYSVDRLVEIANEGGGSKTLSKVGLALQKHGGRGGTTFPSARGSISVINNQGESVLRNILENYGEQTVRHHAKFGEILEYRTSTGQGARFSSDGNSFIGFIEN